MKRYSEDDYLQLSGIQHFVFCRRQWSLIVIEQTWVENYLTQDGRIMHENAHEGLILERRGERLVSRGLPVSSFRLGLTGICDVVEFMRTSEPTGVSLQGIEGSYRVAPIEYKRGKVKVGQEDVMQVAAQAMGLEEMLSATIHQAYLFYGKHQRRHEVVIDATLRSEVHQMADEMHAYYERSYVPQVKYQEKCKACSLLGVCLPKLVDVQSVQSYVRGFANEETT